MSLSELWTIERLLAGREELPEFGRWTELAAGKLVHFSPPSIEHGTAVLNVSKALAEFSQREKIGYACFELGLILARNPDTLRFPAVSLFTEGVAFAESDKTVTEARPTLVIEIPSTNDRRRETESRVARWLEWNVPQVWVLDPVAKQAYAFEPGRSVQPFSEQQTFYGRGPLSGFRTNVGELFKEPKWAR